MQERYIYFEPRPLSKLEFIMQIENASIIHIDNDMLTKCIFAIKSYSASITLDIQIIEVGEKVELNGFARAIY